VAQVPTAHVSPQISENFKDANDLSCNSTDAFGKLMQSETATPLVYSLRLDRLLQFIFRHDVIAFKLICYIWQLAAMHSKMARFILHPLIVGDILKHFLDVVSNFRLNGNAKGDFNIKILLILSASSGERFSCVSSAHPCAI
jgi:hypothetical protein